jgi:hypothetical protein
MIAMIAHCIYFASSILFTLALALGASYGWRAILHHWDPKTHVHPTTFLKEKGAETIRDYKKIFTLLALALAAAPAVAPARSATQNPENPKPDNTPTHSPKVKTYCIKRNTHNNGVQVHTTGIDRNRDYVTQLVNELNDRAGSAKTGWHYWLEEETN